ncbi:ABC transporter substrate-binding protein [Bifidobacterium vespertilionis]|uniref:ABC transporter substrate-binding protein n=1 Tax=Bifidobacterium vespertilionis TaxID=2562524 RepID=A0A5J5DYP9_9BIFI|nr:ABC transporter substrate-binding protein [Bifidobacterium vespertilionis]KAA8821963.1 ABC transporter substrate-binding protein [Bifidobacterium vespertilionis]KAA8823246.1 ABC transporter substrate-binding protein [Bifidobacterium vespertilionis]MBT1180183.1 ABC transporter substrate-binding protein [Bifidobacterium vespertilionis]
MQFSNLKTAVSAVAAVASAAMLLSLAACGTTDEGDATANGSATGGATSGYDVSSVAKDDAIAALVPDDVKSDGKLSVGMELSYAPAEFLANDGKTPLGYDVDISKALAKVMGLEADIVSSTFDSIVPSVGSKYDLGITAMTITTERLDAVDFVSYYKAGSTWAVQKGNPKGVDTSNLCGLKIAVQTGTVQEQEANDANANCPADKKIEVLSSKLQTDAATNVVTGKADVFYADSPVAGYAISQIGGQLEALGGNVGTAKQGIAIKKGDTAMDEAVQKAVTKLMDDGTYMNILKHWGVESGALDKAEINPTDLE